MKKENPRFKKGDTAYIIETNDTIREVEIVSFDSDFVTVRYDYKGSHYFEGGLGRLEKKGGLRVRKSKVYLTLLDAQLVITARENRVKKTVESRNVK